ncbi:MAG: TetR/AcrR family transcriptional regulator [Erysipelotrichaceae bacterium]|nr:TetR/AcrR family transcriptional regulator [Erysipelotrichaceae bacterium]
MKERLTQTAITMWQQYGYNNVSINQICQTCGVTKGSFYHHFLNKESVILEYYNQCLKKARLDIDESTPYAAQIFELIRISTSPLMDLNSDIIMAFLTSPRIREVQNYLNDSFNDTLVYRQMVSCCRRGQESGEIRSGFSAEDLIDTLLITMTGNFYRWVVDRKNYDLLAKDRRQLNIILK